MASLEQYESPAVTVRPDLPVADIADEMDCQGVGSVVVVNGTGAPIGIITDRDLVRRVVVPGLDPADTCARDVMTENLLTAEREGTDSTELLRALAERGVRRMPLTEDGRVTAVISLDDLVLELGAALWNTAEAVAAELRETARMTPSRRRREAREEVLSDMWHQVERVQGKLRKRVVGELRDMLDRLDR